MQFIFQNKLNDWRLQEQRYWLHILDALDCTNTSGKASEISSPICGASVIVGTSTSLWHGRPSLTSWGSIGRSPFIDNIFPFLCIKPAFIFLSSIHLSRFSRSSFWISDMALWPAISTASTSTNSGPFNFLYTYNYILFINFITSSYLPLIIRQLPPHFRPDLLLQTQVGWVQDHLWRKYSHCLSHTLFRILTNLCSDFVPMKVKAWQCSQHLFRSGTCVAKWVEYKRSWRVNQSRTAFQCSARMNTIL